MRIRHRAPAVISGPLLSSLIPVFLALSLGGAAHGAPTISIDPPSRQATNKVNAVTFTVNYTDAASITLDQPGNVVLNTSGTAMGTISVSGTGLGNTTRTVKLTNCTGEGTIGITIPPGTALDANGETAPGAGPSETVVVDNTAPTLEVTGSPAQPNHGEPIVYTLNFGGTDTVTMTNKVTLIKTGASGAIVTGGTGTTTRTVTLNAIGGNGTLQVSIAAGVGTDAAGNKTPAVLLDPVTVEAGPGIAIGPPSTATTESGPVDYTVTYTGATAITLNPSDITLVRSNSANGVISVSGTGTETRTVTISNITGDGTLGISIASGTATNESPYPAAQVGPSARVTVDGPPRITIGAPSQAATNSGPVTYPITYGGAHAVTLSAGDITLNTTGTATGTVAVTGTTNTARTVTISDIAGEGTIGISIAANTAADAGEKKAPAAGPSETFIVDKTPPEAFTPTVNPASWSNTPITVTFAATDAGSGIGSYKMAIDEGTYVVRTSPHEQPITSIASGIHVVHVKAIDKAGNETIGDATIYIDKTAPVTPKAPTDAGVWSKVLGPIDFVWKEVTDAHSGVDHYNCQIGTTPGGSDVFDGNVGLDLTRSIDGANGVTYYCRVQAVDAVGNVGPWSPNSNGIGVDIELPITGTATCAQTSDISPIVVNYSGASDAVSGLKFVRLYYKKGASGLWTNSTLAATTASGSFNFVPPANGTYYFGLTAQDNAGNVTAKPTGDGDCSTVYTAALDISGITSTNLDGAYTTGETISVQVAFKEAVTVDTTAGSPSLELATGAVKRSAVYTGGSGTNSLTFDYTVQAGDEASDLDYTTSAALTPGGATIKLPSDADANLTLPAPGATGSLSANKDISIITDAFSAVSAAKALQDDATVKLLGPVVTRSFENYFYIEDATRSCGIRVNRASGVSPVEGSVPAIFGTLKTIEGERMIDNAAVATRNAAIPAGTLGVFGMSGCSAACGLSQGLLVKLWGKASVADNATDSFVLKDGFAGGMRVELHGVPLPKDGDMLTVTGAIGADAQGLVLRVNAAGDLKYPPDINNKRD